MKSRLIVVFAACLLGGGTEFRPAPELLAPIRACAAVAPETEIVHLIARLGGPRSGRAEAHNRLIEIGLPAVPSLVAALESPDFSTRWGAVNALGAIEDKSSLPAVIGRILRDGNNHVRWRAIWAANQMRDPATVAALRVGLKDPDATVRWNAAVGLSTMQTDDVAPILIEGLRSGSEWTRWEAINALGRIHDTAARDALIPMLSDPTVRIRQETVLSLGKMSGRVAVRSLIGALEDGAAGVRWRAGMSLGQIGDATAIGPLERALSNESDAFARDQLRKALGRLKAKTPK